MRVAGDEVDRPEVEIEVIGGPHQVIPPAFDGPAIVVEAARQGCDTDVRRPLRQRLHLGIELLPPDLMQPGEVILGDAQGVAQRLRLLASELGAGRQLVSQLRDRHPAMQLVPLDLKRRQAGDQIVDIGDAGDERGDRVSPVELHPPPPCGRIHARPARQIAQPAAPKHILRLAQDHPPHVVDAIGQAQRRVEERRCVELRRLGAQVQAGAHPLMRLLQRADADLA